MGIDSSRPCLVLPHREGRCVLCPGLNRPRATAVESYGLSCKHHCDPKKAEWVLVGRGYVAIHYKEVMSVWCILGSMVRSNL